MYIHMQVLLIVAPTAKQLNAIETAASSLGMGCLIILVKKNRYLYCKWTSMSLYIHVCIQIHIRTVVETAARNMRVGCLIILVKTYSHLNSKLIFISISIYIYINVFKYTQIFTGIETAASNLGTASLISLLWAYIPSYM